MKWYNHFPRKHPLDSSIVEEKKSTGRKKRDMRMKPVTNKHKYIFRGRYQ